MLRQILERRRRMLEERRARREMDSRYSSPDRSHDPRVQNRLGGYGSSPQAQGRSCAMRAIPILLAVAIAGFMYFSADTFTNPVTGETVRVALTVEQEEQIGLQSFQKVINESRDRLVTTGDDYELVRDVARRLAEATGDDGDDFDWKVILIDDPQRNAFCLPGGKIAVYTGILPICQDADGLAAVMGHEMAHAIARHAAQRMLRQKVTQAFMGGAQGAFSDLDPGQQRMIMGMLGAGAQYGYILPFSRDHESEADRMGVTYAARAGFDPRAAIGLWRRMGEAGGAQPPEFASTHPSHETRIGDLQRWMPEAVQIANKVRGGQGKPPLQ